MMKRYGYAAAVLLVLAAVGDSSHNVTTWEWSPTAPAWASGIAWAQTPLPTAYWPSFRANAAQTGVAQPVA